MFWIGHAREGIGYALVAIARKKIQVSEDDADVLRRAYNGLAAHSIVGPSCNVTSIAELVSVARQVLVMLKDRRDLQPSWQQEMLEQIERNDGPYQALLEFHGVVEVVEVQT